MKNKVKYLKREKIRNKQLKLYIIKCLSCLDFILFKFL